MKKVYFLFCYCFCLLLFAQDFTILNPKPSFRTGQKVNFSSPNKGFLINDKELFKTTDIGLTWNKVMNINKSNDIYFKDNLGVIYGENGFILKTENYGEDWAQISNFTNSNILKIEIIGDKIFTATPNAVIISDLTFDQKQVFDFSQNIQINTVDFISESIWVAGTYYGSIYKTENAGQTWVLKESVSYSPSDYYFIYFVNESLGFANRGHGEFLKTSDGGETWIKYQNFSTELYDIQFLDDFNGFICGEGNSVWKTTDGGSTWQGVGMQGFGDTDLYGIHFINNTTGFITGDRGRILKTVDGATTWNEFAPFYDDVKKMQKIGTNTIITLVNNNKYMRSDDLGQNWVQITSPAHYSYSTDFFFSSPQIGYSLGGGTSSGNSLFKTTNGGQTWFQLGTTNYDNNGSLYFFDDNHGLLAGENGTFETTNGGQSWLKINTTATKNMQFFDSSNGFATSFGYYSYAKIYKTSDGGKTWIEKFNNFDDPVQTYHFVNQNVGYLSQNSGMKKTIDGGATWQSIHSLSRIDVIRFFSNEIGFIHDDFNHISYRTVDGGLSWIPMKDLSELNTIIIENDVVYFGSHFGQIFSSDITALSLGLASISNITNQLSVYPNPSNGEMFFNSPETVKQIMIFTTEGKLIKQIDNPKTNHFKLDYFTGIYFVQLKTDKGFVTKKIIIK